MGAKREAVARPQPEARLGALSNTVVKAGIVLAPGDRDLRVPTLIATAAVLVVGIATIVLT